MPAMHRLATETAQLLGTHWRAERDDRHGRLSFRLISQDGPPVLLTSDGHRITARALMPEACAERPTHVPEPTITVSGERGAQHIADHIAKRLFPQHIKAMREFQELTDAARTEEQERASTAERVAYALGAETITGEFDAPVRTVSGGYARTRVQRHGDASSAYAEVGHAGTSVELRLTSLTAKQAQELCALYLRLVEEGSPADAAEPSPQPQLTL